MISVLQGIATIVGCMILQQPIATCVSSELPSNQNTPVVQQNIPKKTGIAVDVDLTAQAALVWDISTDTILYERNADSERPIASLNKLLSTVASRQLVTPNTIVTIPDVVIKAQHEGVGIKLKPNEHVSAGDLYEASLIPSANDAMISLAVAAKGSEKDFVAYSNNFAASHGLFHTLQANSTGLQEGVQYSTARDVSKMLMMAYNDSFLRPFLSQQKGEIVSNEGIKHTFITTDKLLGTYLPILAAKTGYTLAAKENLAIITIGPKNQKIGAVILGSEDRFQDMKTVVEYVYRNYTWP
jgi:D-alanyl-D-alanine carboxypeptidase (penicillin-binding protein 5/6)